MNTKEINALQIKPPPPAGVEGWLLFLCLVLVVFAPLADSYHIIFSTVPRLVNAPTFRTMFLLSVYSATFAGLGIFSVIAGVRLWLIKPGAIKLARRYLWKEAIGELCCDGVVPRSRSDWCICALVCLFGAFQASASDVFLRVGLHLRRTQSLLLLRTG